jgi:hypothetical protein
MDVRDRENLKEFLIEVFGSKASRWTMTDRMFELTFDLLNSSGNCSDLMDLVPRPYAIGKEPIKYLSGQIRSSFVRKLKERKRHYSVCMNTAAWHSSHRFEMASQGM